ncbi:MAG: type II/IV secretion system protein [Candidatus Eremiobacteraeota bacterium]|nr:type II/IV secretion system protein [Candidatus Eremiobacteraeota bacterium]
MALPQPAVPDGAFSALPQAVARVPRALAFRHDVLPLNLVDGVLVVALPDPDDSEVVDTLRAATRLPVRALPMARDAIRESLRLAYRGVPATLARADRVDAPAVRVLDRVFARAIAAHASDVHIEPLAGGGARIRERVDGIFRDGETIAKELLAACTSRLKLIAGMDIADRRQPQDGRCEIPFEARVVDARVSSVPTLDGEKLVVRLLDRHGAAPNLEALGMPADILGWFRAAIRAPWGFVVVSGPTGSGKTTTLYASLAALDTTTRSVCSVEDPIEMRLHGVSQVQTNSRAGVSFPVAVRAFMRQDSNVVMIGETRDRETSAVAITVALAGQLVFTTLHANDAPRTIDRLSELGIARQPLAAGLTAIVAQRLVRRLCEQCRVPEAAPAASRPAFGPAARVWYAPGGCRACSGTGYRGRTGVYELLAMDDALRDAIATGSSSVQITRLAEASGYRPMRHDAWAKVLAGTTSFAEVARVVGTGNRE